ncbi:MAG: hypothetical protein MUP47_06685 [Phycisphaerae bacterium]|nr:hypothetical protein [Phycisphaerae bacterium]
MAIGEHKPTKAENRCWKDCMAVLLDEVMMALEESFTGLKLLRVGCANGAP